MSYALKKEIDNAHFELSKLKEERSRDQQHIDQLRNLNGLKERENCDLDNRIKASDYDLYKAQERAAELAKIADAREFDLRRTTEAFEKAHAALLHARDENAFSQDENGAQNRTRDLKNAEKGDLVRRSEAELARNRDLTAHLYDLEAKSRIADEALSASRREQDDLRFANQSLHCRNEDTRSEIEALEHHCNVLTGQNRELNIELERFVQTDEQIRQTLNRRDRVENLRHKTEVEVMSSKKNLERSSPRRKY
jgi:chromosome segregation ATPase